MRSILIAISICVLLSAAGCAALQTASANGATPPTTQPSASTGPDAAQVIQAVQQGLEIGAQATTGTPVGAALTIGSLVLSAILGIGAAINHSGANQNATQIAQIVADAAKSAAVATAKN